MAEEKSNIKKIEVPKFHPKIPYHLLAQCNEKEKYLYESISTLEQKADWLIQKTAENNQEIRYTNGKVNKNMEDINDLQKKNTIFSSKWGMTKLIIGWVLSILTTSVGTIGVYVEFIK